MSTKITRKAQRKSTSAKATGERESESVAKAKSAESSNSTIRPSDEFLQILESSYKFAMNRKNLNKNQIKTMETKMDKLCNKIVNSRRAKFNDVIALAYSYQNVCHTYMQSNQREELHIAKNFILRCISLIRDKELDSKSILISLKAHNSLGYIYAKQKKTEKAIEVYDNAVKLYLTYTQEIEKYGIPIDCQEICNPRPKLNGWEKLKNLYIFILQSLMELRTFMTSQNDHSLMTYSHLFLATELSRLPETKAYLDWIKKATTLCGYLLRYGRFTETRNHLTAAIYVKHVFIDEKCNNTSRKEDSSEAIKLENKTATYYIADCWIKYGLALLRKSAERLLRLEKGDSEDVNLKSEDPAKLKKQILPELLLIDEIEKGISMPDEYGPISVQYIMDYDNAYATFTQILRYLYNRRPHFKIGADTKLYIQFIHDTCNAYKYMAVYEKDTNTRIALQTRRQEVLADAMKVMNIKDPMAAKNLRIYLAIAFSSLIDIKVELLEKAHPVFTPGKHRAILWEIETLVESGLVSLEGYIHLYR